MRGWRDEHSVPIRPTAATLAGINTITGKVAAVNPEAKTVTLTDESEISFDALVLATGSRNAIEIVPGLQRAYDEGVAVHFYAADAAAAAHRALSEFAGGNLVFLITAQPFRCPVAPYEGTLLAADLLRENGKRDRTEISLYTPEKQPMYGAGDYAGFELMDLLKTEEVEVHLEHAVERIDPDHRVIHFENGKAVDFDLLVFVPPHQPTITLDRPGWISIDTETMQTNYPGIWAIGDITTVTCPSGRPLPKAAVFAKNGGKAAAGNILKFLGKTGASDPMSGLGHCYIDTGAYSAVTGKTDFFQLPLPELHLSEPSQELEEAKQAEEMDWRACWE
ncbi:Sulfide dehydrogenase [flavocytochrome c] flavoprotein chain [Mycobacterium attenuatum]|uniref:Sulfide dehydrogenase [flavocytochrome c] flavoprotein chain n=2 Tax=Mycobacterium attenuatum TaxID=2341086 RepID=A0A498QH57_9MYCO|nr:Sulfide dehydrogenase [flavocytochrome c] flavoprotein chain [Mycobacterium attenuatum]